MAIPRPPHLHEHGPHGGAVGSWVYVICADSGDGVSDVLLRGCKAQRQCGVVATAEDNGGCCGRERDDDQPGPKNQWGEGQRWLGRKARGLVVMAVVGVVQYAQLQIRYILIRLQSRTTE